jgi:hypothetical protein
MFITACEEPPPFTAETAQTLSPHLLNSTSKRNLKSEGSDISFIMYDRPSVCVCLSIRLRLRGTTRHPVDGFYRNVSLLFLLKPAEGIEFGPIGYRQFVTKTCLHVRSFDMPFLRKWGRVQVAVFCFLFIIIHCHCLHLYFYTYSSVPLVSRCKYLFILAKGTIL